MNALETMRGNGSGSETDFATLMNTVGCCQLNLGRTALAAQNFADAYKLFRELAATDPTGRKGQLAYDGVCSIVDEYLSVGHYEEMSPWIDHAEELLRGYEQLPVAEKKIVESAQAKIDLLRAIALQHTGQTREAAKAYNAAAKTSLCEQIPRGSQSLR